MGKEGEIKGLGDGWRSFLSWIDMVEFTQNRYDRKWVKKVRWRRFLSIFPGR
jgi:hypothetical protein